MKFLSSLLIPGKGTFSHPNDGKYIDQQAVFGNRPFVLFNNKALPINQETLWNGFEISIIGNNPLISKQNGILNS